MRLAAGSLARALPAAAGARRAARRRQPPGRLCGTEPLTKSTQQPQRFDHSFVILMVRDFFLVLVAVVVLEMGVRFLLVLYTFHNEKPEEVQVVADRLASNVRSIMLNKGGPVAAETVYPIIRRNHEELDLEIAIEPSPVTIESIRQTFDMVPEGIPAEWPEEGEYVQAKEQVRADQFCLQCHVSAEEGDTLGVITVRSYLADEVKHWWEEVRFAGLLNMGKILGHTVVLFLLLRVRMESILSLKSVVSLLAKSGSRTSHRAPVVSSDEFGELARDLNLFLDRVEQVIEDLSEVLRRLSEMTERLTGVQERMDERQPRLEGAVRDLVGESFDAAGHYNGLDEQWLASARSALESLLELARRERLPADERARLDALLDQFTAQVEQFERAVEQNRRVGHRLLEIDRELRAADEAFHEMARIEERMRTISARGQTLLQRLRGSDARDDEADRSAD